ncbi:uncharacterized protein LOC143040638 isoform X1 [Oratosquilla oratoria]|uniref:uncharacterized protein LOC143040638 isoform X1 n=1 Tax=Oratosquilla oratoria TaxID=337810 RepID=UPI003F77746F
MVRHNSDKLVFALLPPLLLLLLLQYGADGGVLNVPLSVTERDDNTTPNDINQIEKLVLDLEKNRDSVLDNALVGHGLPADLDKLPDDVVADGILEGLEEEFNLVDATIDRDANTTSSDRSILPAHRPHSRQLSLLYQGVYAPDARFNAFVDGVMVNMVAEMKRKRMDPLYFRVYDRGIVEHVPRRNGRDGRRDEPSAIASFFRTDLKKESPEGDSMASASASGDERQGRQAETAIGGGVIRGLTGVKRFGNGEVQVAGNTTLVRSHYIFGPLDIELLFETERGVKSIESTLTAVAAHTLAEVSGNNSARMLDFVIDSPLEYEIDLVGLRSVQKRRISRSAILRMFKPGGRMERRLQRCFSDAGKKPIPDVTQKKTNEGKPGSGGERSSGRSQGRSGSRRRTQNGEARSSGGGGQGNRRRVSGDRKNGNRRNINRKNKGNSTTSTTTELPVLSDTLKDNVEDQIDA